MTNLNKLLQKQVKKHLTQDHLKDPAIELFLNAINESYLSYDKDKELLNHSFAINEEEYQKLFSDLSREHKLKELSIEKLKEAVIEVASKDEVPFHENFDELIVIVEYLNTQILKRKETEIKLSQTLDLLKTLLTNLNSGILFEDENRKILFTNQLFCNFFNIQASPESLIGFDCNNSAEQTKDLFKQPISFIAEINKLLYFKVPVFNQILEMKTGLFLERHYVPIYIDGEYKGNLWKYTDVTEKINIQKELKKSEENYRRMIDHASDIIYKADNKGFFIFVNPVTCRVTGYTKEELYKMHFSELIRSDYKTKAVRYYLNQVKNRVSSTYFEFPIITKGGKELWIGQSVQFSLKTIDDFELTALAIDITVRRKSEEALKESNQKLTLLQNLIDNSSDSIQVATEAGELFYYNKEAKQRLGLPDGNLDRFSVIDIEENFKSLEDWKLHIAELKEKNVITIEGNNINQNNGKCFPVEITARFVEINDIGYVIANARDITARKQIESLLKKQEEKYRNIIANMNLGLIEVDMDEKILHANQSFCNMSGYNADDLIGKNAKKLFTQKENFNIIESKIKLRAKNISDMYQMPIKDKKGNTRWWSISGAPNFNDSGELIGSIGIHLDITDQKLLERDLEAALLKAELGSKAKEAFLANMSHEIRTPLNAIIGMIRELNKEKLSVTQKTYVENSSIASKHLLSIINNVLDISKIEAGELTLEEENFQLERSINNVFSIMSSRAEEKNIYLRYEFSELIHKTFTGDPLRLEQILINLIGNAIKFTANGGITIECSLLDDFIDKQVIKIAVTDTGIGMDEEYLKNAFKKFTQEDKSVSRKYGGTGLGLAITYELVQLMDGKIEIESKKNSGTTFSVVIQFRKSDEQNIESKVELQENFMLDGIKILLVEDNELNRLVVQNTFKYYKCVADEAINGLDALEKLKSKSYDVILMDIQMPEMGGLEATEKIRKQLNLETPIIALTANAFKSEIEKCKLAGMNDYITKPFEESTLLKIIGKYTMLGSNNTKMPRDTFNNLKSDKMYDLGKLKVMSRGDDEFIKKMVNLFIQQARVSLVEIDSAHIKYDWDSVHKIAHRLKPSIDNMGIQILYTTVRDIEKESKAMNGPNSVLSSKIAFFNDTLNRVLIDLEKEIPS